MASAVSTPDGGTTTRAAAPRQRPISTRFLRSELLLIFGRRRNWAGLAILAALPTIIAVVIKVDPSNATGPTFFNGITHNGLFVALASLSVELPLFLPLAVAVISADSIAGEANLGTLRYLLAVPVQRTRMLVAKYAAIVVFTFAATLLVAAVGTLLGLAFFGGGSGPSLSGTELSFGEVSVRLVGVSCYIAICLSALGAIGIFISSLTEQPIGGAIAVLIFFMISMILGTIPQLAWLHPYLPTRYWQAYGDLLRDPVNLGGELRDGLISAGTYILVFWTAAWARFTARNITS